MSYPARAEGLVNMIMLSVKQGGIKYHFLFFGMSRPGIETRSAEPWANTLNIIPMGWLFDSEDRNSVTGNCWLLRAGGDERKKNYPHKRTPDRWYREFRQIRLVSVILPPLAVHVLPGWVYRFGSRGASMKECPQNQTFFGMAAYGIRAVQYSQL